MRAEMCVDFPEPRRRTIHASRNLSRAPLASLSDRLRRPWTEPVCRKVRQQSVRGRVWAWPTSRGRPEPARRVSRWHAQVVMANETHEGLKRCIRTREVGIWMIRVAQVTDQKAVPLACPIGWSTEGHHGHFRAARQASRPGLTHMGQVRSPRRPDTEDVVHRPVSSKTLANRR
jgi:hypothetical protein